MVAEANGGTGLAAGRATAMNTSEHHGLLYRRKLLPYGFAMAMWQRPVRRLYGKFEEHFPPSPGMKVLDLGVDATQSLAPRLFFEYYYPYRENIVAAGLEGPDEFQALYPQVEYVRLDRGKGLPFEDRSFDVVFCNAVVEHVGDRRRQREFLAEALRVGKAAFVSTPNRWYPIETHTVFPLVHYLPPRAFRFVLRKTGFDFFSREENLNLLDRKSLRALLPEAFKPHCQLSTLRYLGFASNLIVVYREPATR